MASDVAQVVATGGLPSATWISEEGVGEAAGVGVGLAVAKSAARSAELPSISVEVDASGRRDSAVGIRTPFASVIGTRVFQAVVSLASGVPNSTPGREVVPAGALSAGAGRKPSVGRGMSSPVDAEVGVRSIDGVGASAGSGVGSGVTAGGGIPSVEGVGARAADATSLFSLVALSDGRRIAVGWDFGGTLVFWGPAESCFFDLVRRVFFSPVLLRAFVGFSFAVFLTFDFSRSFVGDGEELSRTELNSGRSDCLISVGAVALTTEVDQTQLTRRMSKWLRLASANEGEFGLMPMIKQRACRSCV